MILENDSSALDQQEMYFPDLQEQIQQIRNYHQQKLWHQVSESLLKYIENEDLQSGSSLIELYNNFIRAFENRIDQLKLMKIAMKVSEKYQDYQQGINFISEIRKRSISEEQAIILYEIKKAILELKNEQDEFHFSSLDTLNVHMKICESGKQIDRFVFSNLYKLGYLYYQMKNDREQFYKYALQYLAYTSTSTLSHSHKLELSIQMGISVLISQKIYNFSELLEQPVLQSLESDGQGWIYEMLKIFNNGNVKEYECFMDRNQNKIGQYSDLVDNQVVMTQKIKMMAFLQLVFQLPKNNRSLSYQQILQTSCLSDFNQVEYLLMRAMELELIKGKIDAINNRVKINYIIPQVLDLERIKVIKNKVNGWQNQLNKISSSLESQFKPQ